MLVLKCNKQTRGYEYGCYEMQCMIIIIQASIERGRDRVII